MNRPLAILYLYPYADPTKDFIVQDNADGTESFIAFWNLQEPQPTEAELLAAWEAYQEAEANKPPVLTEVETLQLALADTYEQLLTAQGDATSAQVALADLYELTLSLQADVTALKGGES